VKLHPLPSSRPPRTRDGRRPGLRRAPPTGAAPRAADRAPHAAQAEFLPHEELVLFEPSAEEAATGKAPIGVPPVLCQFLRAHQREGVQFMFECVMGMREVRRTDRSWIEMAHFPPNLSNGRRRRATKSSARAAVVATATRRCRGSSSSSPSFRIEDPCSKNDERECSSGDR